MRGEVLELSSPARAGLILGQDGKRYNYSAGQVRSDDALTVGQAVDFIGLGDDARDIYIVSMMQAAAAPIATPGQGAEQNAAAPAPAYATTGALIAPELSLWGYFIRGITKHYVQFQGRGRRSEYWGYTLFWWIFLVGAVFVDIAVSLTVSGATGSEAVLPIFTILWYLGTILPNIAIVVRRLHDTGNSGWLILIRGIDAIIPLAGTLVIFIFTLLDSKRETNKHGPSPKYGSEIVDAFA